MCVTLSEHARLLPNRLNSVFIPSNEWFLFFFVKQISKGRTDPERTLR